MCSSFKNTSNVDVGSEEIISKFDKEARIVQDVMYNYYS